jgi:hypothetical protein
MFNRASIDDGNNVSERRIEHIACEKHVASTCLGNVIMDSDEIDGIDAAAAAVAAAQCCRVGQRVRSFDEHSVNVSFHGHDVFRLTRSGRDA